MPVAGNNSRSPFASAVEHWKSSPQTLSRKQIHNLSILQLVGTVDGRTKQQGFLHSRPTIRQRSQRSFSARKSFVVIKLGNSVSIECQNIDG